MLHASLPIVSQIIEPNAVLVQIHNVQKTILAVGPLSRIDFHLENGILDALPKIQACLGGQTKSLSAGRGFGGDVVSDKYVHGGRPNRTEGSLPNECRIRIKVAAQMPRQQASLQMWQEPKRRCLVKEWVFDRILLSLFPSHQHGQFIPLNLIDNIRVPIPALWICLNRPPGFMLNDDPCVALHTGHRPVSIFWDKVEEYEVKECPS